MDLHMGRAWTGHVIEDSCPCAQAPCGLAVMTPGVECDHHNPRNPLFQRTMRQMHMAKDCPGAEHEVVVSDGPTITFPILEGEGDAS